MRGEGDRRAEEQATRGPVQAADGPVFDTFRDTYESELSRALAFVSQDADLFTAAKADVLTELVRRHRGDPRGLDALDVGCGTGATDCHLIGRFRTISGADVSAGMIERARENNPSLDYRLFDGRRLPYPDETFDVVFAICVVHHVPPAEWEGFALDLKRVTRRGGLTAIFEHNPLNPATRLIVNRCSFDTGANLLTQWRCRHVLESAGLRPLETRNILFVPWRHRVFELAERALCRFPFGAQYVVAASRP